MRVPIVFLSELSLRAKNLETRNLLRTVDISIVVSSCCGQNRAEAFIEDSQPSILALQLSARSAYSFQCWAVPSSESFF